VTMLIAMVVMARIMIDRGTAASCTHGRLLKQFCFNYSRDKFIYKTRKSVNMILKQPAYTAYPT
jgi:hypothetical protein